MAAGYQYRPPEQPPPFTYSIVIGTSILVEVGRSFYHPELARVLRHPHLLVGCALLATLAFHVWAVPDARLKALVSTILTQTSMPTILLVTVKAAVSIALAIGGLISDLTRVG